MILHFLFYAVEVDNFPWLTNTSHSSHFGSSVTKTDMSLYYVIR
jgi:hypothetical protein